MIVEVSLGGRRRQVEFTGSDVVLDGRRLHVDVAAAGAVQSVILGPAGAGAAGLTHGRSHEVVVVDQASGGLAVQVNGRLVPVDDASAGPGRGRRSRGRGERASVAGNGPLSVVAPMPGRVARVLVRAGDVVEARQGLVVVEAMKMENELRSPRAGTVVAVHAREGARVEANTVLVVVDQRVSRPAERT
jgi:biotin carboxyl carrier protein